MQKINKNRLFIAFVLSVFLVFLIFFEFKTDKDLEISFLDVGQGDAIYIKAFNSADMLIDGGKNSDILERKLFEVMSTFDDTIDVLLITHPDEDHSGGLLYVLNEYKIGSIFISGNFSENTNYNQILKIAHKKNIPTFLARAGTNIYLDKDRKVKFEILSPDRDVSFQESNNTSIVGRLVYGKSEFMVTGDAYVEIEKYLVSKGISIESDILKLGHHGSKTSSADIFLKAVKPEVVIVSASQNNTYGHPHKEVVDRVSALSIKSLATYELGTITFRSDGERIYLAN